MSEPIRVLHVFASVNRGGAESRTMDLYRHIDREKVQFDFLVNVDEPGHYAAEIREMGGRIYHIPRFRLSNYFSYRKAVTAFFSVHHDFRAVHGHITSSAAIYLPLAKKAGIPVTIAHARNAGEEPGLKRLLTHLLRRRLHRRADHLFACSKLAGEAVFSRKVWAEGRIAYIPNAISAARFDYDEGTRAALREQMGLAGQFVLGHVGRFDYQKNHPYLLKIFFEVQKMLPDSRLLIVGGGNSSGQESFRLAAGQLGLADKIVYTGVVDDPWRYYQAMDYFVFPSYFEGMPGVVIEAQTSGLPCLISDAIAGEVALTELVNAKSIAADPREWADYIVAAKDYRRYGRVAEIQAAGFDAHTQAKKMAAFYLSHPKKRILLIAPNFYQGGFQRICVETARLLKPHLDVSIVLFNGADIAFDIEGLHIIDIDRGVRRGRLAKLVNVAIRAAKVRKLKRRLRPDVTYSFGSTANTVAALAKTRHDRTWLSLHSYMDMDAKYRLRLFMAQADRLICCSQGLAEALWERYHYDKAFTLHNPHDVARMRCLAAEGEPEWPWADDGGALLHLITMGRDDDVKGYWHTLKVFFLVWQQYPQVRLTFLGGGAFAEYRRLAEDLGLADKVHFAGMQRNPYKFLKKGTVYLLTSLMEGFPNALIEAMAMGMAAVAADCPTGPAEILRESDDESREAGVEWADYGVLVPPLERKKNLDPAHISAAEREMAAAVIKLLSDPPLLEHYRRAAASRAEDFSCDVYVGQILDWLENP